MPKMKQNFSESRKKGKQKNHTPETADEFLAGMKRCNQSLDSSLKKFAAGVEFEEGGEKWRAGDAAKSTRFFIRAVDNYETALLRFPRSFDVAYNK
ncbi:MAG: hypothetical protein M1830_002205 [Pleopsidium flavum]|nr:MAG: hypothetical protein M1830_002205 [Pleopsidium flavum]